MKKIIKNLRILNPAFLCLVALLALTANIPQAAKAERLYAANNGGSMDIAGVSAQNTEILILNSDASLIKYSTAQETFNKAMGGKCKDVDLGNKWEKSNIKNIVEDKNHGIIYCIGSKAFRMAQKYGKNKNIIFSLAINWERFKVGKNTYGVSNELNPAMKLMMYKYIFPDVKSIGVIYSKKYSKEWVASAKESAKNMDINIIARSINNPEGLETGLKKLMPEVDALWLIPDPVVLSGRDAVKQIFDYSNELNKPVFAYSELFAEQGAVVAISPDIPTVGRQAAGIAKDLMANSEISEKVVGLAGSSIVLNLKQVEKYGLKYNLDALDSVNRVIK